MRKCAVFAAKRGSLVGVYGEVSKRYFFLISLVNGRTANFRVTLRANLVVSGHLSWNRII